MCVYVCVCVCVRARVCVCFTEQCKRRADHGDPDLILHPDLILLPADNDGQAHPWFNEFDWDGLKGKTFPAPLQPNMDQVNCDMGAEVSHKLEKRKF